MKKDKPTNKDLTINSDTQHDAQKPAPSIKGLTAKKIKEVVDIELKYAKAMRKSDKEK